MLRSDLVSAAGAEVASRDVLVCALGDLARWSYVPAYIAFLLGFRRGAVKLRRGPCSSLAVALYRVQDWRYLSVMYLATMWPVKRSW